MGLIEERFLTLPCGGIVYDAARVRHPELQLFQPDHWAARAALEEVAGGRQSVYFLRVDAQRWVLRHYRRGGWAAALSKDRYLWLGAARTRCLREWRLLAELYRRGLPVPAPVAACYLRAGPTYRADLITVALPPSRTLAEAITGAALAQEEWRQVGVTLARFHAQGVHHADLNAHNVLLGQESVYLLDFDRGRLQARGAWEQAVLQRLQRSLQKIQRQRSSVYFGEREWNWLLAGVAAEPGP